MKIEPADEWNRALAQNVRPSDWVNPKPAERYNLIVIGAGTAGLVAAAGAAGLGARVALIERHLLGGDCLNYGCVPSKALLRAARAVSDARRAEEFGLSARGEPMDFPRVMERMRRLRAQISPHDSARRFTELGVDVFFGDAKFVGGDIIEVDSTRLRFVKAVIATGARAVILNIKGLQAAGCLTNETVFSLTRLPPELIIIGAGPIGCELAQAFRRFGARVRLMEAADRVLPREDADAGAIIHSALVRDGVEVSLNARIQEVQARDGKKIVILEQPKGDRVEMSSDEILVGAGRAPNVEGLNLEAARVDYSAQGIRVDEHLRTSNRKIFAAGDICLPFKFTHTADASARIVIQNALFGGRKKWTDLVVPWCTYTDPELAHVGMSPREAAERGIAVQTITEPLAAVDRAVLDGETDGLLKVHLRRGSDRILGATLVARHAGEMISELTLAITAGIGLKRIAQTIHCYPTQAEIVKRAADGYNRSRLTPRWRALFQRYFAYLR